ncbi:hypothetical protein Agub_g2893, partial [Astrephomene gubernaculifera]
LEANILFGLGGFLLLFPACLAEHRGLQPLPMKPLAARRSATDALASSYSRRSSVCRTRVRPVAFRERDDIKDWRVKEMADSCRTYYSSLWNRGQLTAAEELLDPNIVLRDPCNVGNWGLSNGGNSSANSNSSTNSSSNGGNYVGGGVGGGLIPATGLIVGPKAVQALVSEARRHYPDLHIEVDEVAVSDSHRIFAAWTARGTPAELVLEQHRLPYHQPPAPTSWPSASSASSHPTGRSSSQHPQLPSAQPHNQLHNHNHRSSRNQPGFLHARAPQEAAWVTGTPAAPAIVAGGSAPHVAGLVLHGVDVITFNYDRSRIAEITTYRQLSGEERREVEWRLTPHPLEIRLARLQW